MEEKEKEIRQRFLKRRQPLFMGASDAINLIQMKS